jgi:hypothetical protein
MCRRIFGWGRGFDRKHRTGDVGKDRAVIRIVRYAIKLTRDFCLRVSIDQRSREEDVIDLRGLMRGAIRVVSGLFR